jgi:hypothetical protein
MATDLNLDGTSLEGHQEPTKVTFTDEQQSKIQQLIDTAVGRTRANASKEFTDKITALNTEIETLKTSKAGKTGEASEADRLEFKNIVEQAKAETERYKQEAITRERETQAARSEAQEVRKEVAIANSASKIPFFNIEVVKTLTKDSITFDSERGQFVVKGPNGQTRLDSTLEKPLSLDAYFAEFAAQNKYLVRSEIGSGTGSSETSRTDVAKNGRYAVTDIFGPKSSSAKASSLMKENPDEYKRLKGIARTEGLIA